jgi:hypothetical protein
MFRGGCGMKDEKIKEWSEFYNMVIEEGYSDEFARAVADTYNTEGREVEKEIFLLEIKALIIIFWQKKPELAKNIF